MINKTSNDYFYELGINAGYIHNELNINNNNYSGLAITEGYAIPDGTVKLVSYVDGVQTEGGSFPTTGYYSADVTCQLADGTYDYEIGHARWDGTKWLIKIDYAPQDTICNAIFTTNNNPYPIFTYTCSDGTDCTNDVTKVKLIEDGDGNWRIVFKASGTFRTTYPEANAIDIFLVGGGGGGSAGNYWSNYASGSGGGGGYTKTYSIADANNNVLITINSNTEYSVTIGAGGAAGSSNHANGSAGGNSSFGTYSVNGAAATTTSGVYCTGGNGGSGGGGSIMYNQTGGVGGYNGGAGESLGYVTGGTGQGSNTCEFGEYVGTSCKVGGACTCKYSTSNGYEAAVLDRGMYAGGGGAGSGSAAGGAGGGGNGASDGGKGVAGKANTGGGGGGGSTNKTSSGTAGGKGGSGVVIIRNHM